MTRERTHWDGCWQERTHHNCALARIATLEAELAAERIQPNGKSFAYINTMLRAGRDVMAVIHREGGHYREAHGDRKAADDAISIVTKLRVDLAAERERREAAERILLNIRQGGWVGAFTPDFNAHFARYKD